MESAPSSPHRPLVGVSVLLIEGGRVLLVRRAHPPFAGLWSLPGGKVEAGERLREVAIREIREETGLAVDDLRQIDLAEIIVRDDGGGVRSHMVLVVFAGRAGSGKAIAGDDAAEVRWVAPAEMEGLQLTEDTRRVVADAFAGGSPA